MNRFTQKDLFQESEVETLSHCIYVGCAGWSIPAAAKGSFQEKGTHLERYARVFSSVEINSSFYRPHRAETYLRWHDSVPERFRFSVKIPRIITHTKRMQNCRDDLIAFMQSVSGLREKLGCLLVQLPPSFQYSLPHAACFFKMLREVTEVDIVCEPRHPSWFTLETIELLDQFRISLVEADPQININIHAGKYEEVMYVRLHGSPEIYYSSYPKEYLESLSRRLLKEKQSKKDRRIWCIFDNTASGAAIENALWTLTRLTTV